MSAPIHKFTCGSNHVFYLPLNFPMPANEVAKLLHDISCPFCQTKYPLRIHSGPLRVEGLK